MRISIENLSYIYNGNERGGGGVCGREHGREREHEHGRERGCGRTVDALKNISCTIESGDFVGIMGQTGCGKTTLIQLMAGLLTPTAGRILLDGNDINDKSYDRNVLRQSIGVVFQYPEQQLFATTVEKDVAFGLKYGTPGFGSGSGSGSGSRSGLSFGFCSGEVDERVKWALETMGFDFDEVRKQSPMALSGGEKRRVAIAGVLAIQPKIIIFDEPIAGLDPYGRQNFLELVAKLNDNGTTIILISHNMDALAEYTKHLLVLEDGRLIMSGATRTVFLSLEGRTEPQRVAALIAKHAKCQAHDNFRDDVVTYDDLIAAITGYLLGEGFGVETGTEAGTGSGTGVGVSAGGGARARASSGTGAGVSAGGDLDAGNGAGGGSARK